MLRKVFIHVLLFSVAGVFIAVLSSLVRTPRDEIVIAFIFTVMAIYGLLATVLRVSTATKIHQDHVSTRAQALRKVFPKTKIFNKLLTHRDRIIWGSVVLTVGVAIFVISPQSRRFPFVSFISALLYAAQWSLFYWATSRIPPSVLMLGTSSEACGASLHHLRKTLPSHRVIALLDIAENRFLQATDRLDNFRASRDTDWKPLFHTLLDFVPVVVVDTRADTEALRYEARAITKSHAAQVILLLSDQQKNPPLLQSLSPTERRFYKERAQRVTPDILDSTVANFLSTASSTRVPDKKEQKHQRRTQKRKVKQSAVLSGQQVLLKHMESPECLKNGTTIREKIYYEEDKVKITDKIFTDGYVSIDIKDIKNFDINRDFTKPLSIVFMIFFVLVFPQIFSQFMKVPEEIKTAFYIISVSICWYTYAPILRLFATVKPEIDNYISDYYLVLTKKDSTKKKFLRGKEKDVLESVMIHLGAVRK